MFYSVHKLPIEYVFASPLIITLSPFSSQYSIPTRSDICKAINSFLLSLVAQNGIKEQWAEPVTGSSKIEACETDMKLKKKRINSRVYAPLGEFVTLFKK
jgi:hypothetical protein